MNRAFKVLREGGSRKMQDSSLISSFNNSIGIRKATNKLLLQPRNLNSPFKSTWLRVENERLRDQQLQMVHSTPTSQKITEGEYLTTIKS